MAEFEDGLITDRRSVPVSPETAFRAVATGEGLQNWFPLRAEVEPRVGGRCLLSWGETSEGVAPIHAYSPPRTAEVGSSRAPETGTEGVVQPGVGHFGWTEKYPAPADGEEPTVRTVDFHVEPGAEHGAATVRLVHSGFATDLDPGTDAELLAYLQGWSSFMYGLEFYLTHHAGVRRQLVWYYGQTGTSREEAWNLLVGDRRCSGGLISCAQGIAPGSPVTFAPVVRAADQRGGPKLHAAVGRIVSAREGGHVNVVLPALGKSLLFIEFEDSRVGVWCSTYGLDDTVVAGLQTALDTVMAEGVTAA